MELRVFQSMWGMERLGADGTELPLDEKVGRIAAAGFRGAEVEFDDYELARETTRLLAERDLDWTAECFPETVDELTETIERIVEFGTGALQRHQPAAEHQAGCGCSSASASSSAGSGWPTRRAWSCCSRRIATA